MKVQFLEDSILIRADNAPEMVYLQSFEGKELDVHYTKYRVSEDSDEFIYTMRIQKDGNT